MSCCSTTAFILMGYNIKKKKGELLWDQCMYVAGRVLRGDRNRRGEFTCAKDLCIISYATDFPRIISKLAPSISPFLRNPITCTYP